MACRIKCSRQELQRVSDRKNKELAIDESDQTYDSSECVLLNPEVEVVEDSQESLKGHRDLFGELIPYKKNPSPETISGKKKPVSKTKKQPYEELYSNITIKRPTRVFIPTPRIIKIMKEAQTELYSLMGLNKSPSDVSIVSSPNNSLNVSGIENLNNSPTSSPNNLNNDNHKSPILRGKFLLIILLKFYKTKLLCLF